MVQRVNLLSVFKDIRLMTNDLKIMNLIFNNFITIIMLINFG
jgi:hypothetical protein